MEHTVLDLGKSNSFSVKHHNFTSTYSKIIVCYLVSILIHTVLQKHSGLPDQTDSYLEGNALVLYSTSSHSWVNMKLTWGLYSSLGTVAPPSDCIPENFSLQNT